ncbi:MAG: RagB/SusD family nutrient uptake outer membrane protein [Chitinophagaceae bacterium]|nr:RagB/SusD family nutrient uptake outer membrane protein [Chitinophagaceae bacterium]
MKKSFLKYILAGFLITGLNACEKSIEINPTHSATIENAFKSIGDYDAGLSGIYNSMRGVGYYGRNLSVLPDMSTDNLVQTTESLVNFLEVTDWLYTPQNGTVGETWLGCYNIIANANIIINNIDKVVTPANQKQANRIKGQALAIRALVHFDLLRYFGENFDRNSTGLGVVYRKISVLEESPATTKPARQTVKQNYDDIFADLNTARTLLGDIDAPVNTGAKYKIDLIGLSAIYARVALYAKDWPVAISNATTVINALPLASRSVYPSIWRDQSNAEVAFAVFFSPGEFLSRLAGDVYSPTPGTNRSQFEGNPTLFTQIDEVNDVRFPTSVTRGFSTTSLVRSNSRLVVTKYLGKGSALDGVVDWKAFRTGEMYLIRAEAYANTTGQEALGLADLNTLRAARINGFVNGSETGTALITAIATERRKELFMEGHRWFDLKRTTRTIDRVSITSPTTSILLAPGRREWVWPIPQGERDANSNIQQNTGY